MDGAAACSASNVARPLLSGSDRSSSTTSAPRSLQVLESADRRSATVTSMASAVPPASRSISRISRASPGLSSISRARMRRSRSACHDLFGSVTIVSQKSSIDLTTVMNCSRSTGLVM